MSGPAHVPGTVPWLLQQRVLDSPQAPAFAWEPAAARGTWQSVSWEAFARDVRRIRRALAACGLRKGHTLAIVAPVSLPWELLHHAALSMGVAVAGIDAHDLPGRIADMVELADVTALAVADGGTLVALDPARRARCRLVVALGSKADIGPGMPHVVSWQELEALGDAAGAGAAGAADAGAAGAADDAIQAPAPQDVATIVFTSGTTGAPKGIAYRHAQVCLAIEAICGAFDFVGPSSRLLCWLPLSNLFQRIVNLAAVASGACSHLLADPRRVMEVAAGVEPAVFIGVPRFYEKLHAALVERIAAAPALQRHLATWAWQVGRRASARRRLGRKLPLAQAAAWWLADRLVLRRIRGAMGRQLRCMVSGSAPAPRWLLEDLHALGWTVLEAYGLSENVLPMAMNTLRDFRLGSVGRPLAGNRIEIGDEGVVRVSGPGVFEGYLHAAQAAGPGPDGFFDTGDLGRLDADGYLWLTGRRSEIIKTSTGRRIAPAPIEQALQSVRGVDRVLVFGNGLRQPVAIAFVDPAAPCSAADRARIGAALAGRVAALGTPQRPAATVVVEHALSIAAGELTPNLKARREVIQARFATLVEQALARAADGAPDSPAVWWPGPGPAGHGAAAHDCRQA